MGRSTLTPALKSRILSGLRSVLPLDFSVLKTNKFLNIVLCWVLISSNQESLKM